MLNSFQMDNRRLNSVTTNLIVTVGEIIGLLMIFSSIGLKAVEYYTVDSNIVCLFACLFMAISQILVVFGKREEVPQWVVSFKYCATCLVAVTFIVVVTILAPFDASHGMPLSKAYSTLLLHDNMLWLHFICPLVCVLSFVFFDSSLEERTTRPVEALIPTEIYGVILVQLNAVRKVVGPYPFLMMYNQTLKMSVIWMFAVFGVALLLAWLIYLWKKKAQQVPLRRTRMSFLYALAKVTYSPVFLRKQHVSVVNEMNIDIKKGPVLLISNHCGAHDPVILSCIMPRQVCWVAGAYLFKSPLFCFIFKYLAKCIPMQQGQSDLGAVRKMQQSLRAGDMVGLFPEGTRTWDGDMVQFDTKPLAKMIRMFAVPTLFVNIEGGYAMQPRWADNYRTGGGINVNFRALLKSEEIKAMSVDQIREYIDENFAFSNDEWKKTTDYHFESEKRAEGVQRLLYICPKCKKIGTIKAKDNGVSCRCGFNAEIDSNDNLICSHGRFKTLSQWHAWERKKIGKETSFRREKGVLFEKAPMGDAEFETLSTDISVHLKNDILRVFYKDCGKRHIVNFPFNKISSLILNTKQTIELVMAGEVYRIRLLPDGCSLKYHEKYLSFCENKKK